MWWSWVSCRVFLNLLCAGGRSTHRKRNKRRARANERRRLDPFSFSVRQTEIKINRLVLFSCTFNETRFETAASWLKRAFCARNCVSRRVGEVGSDRLPNLMDSVNPLIFWIRDKLFISYYNFNHIIILRSWCHLKNNFL